MTIYKIENVIGVMKEMHARHQQIGSIWEYTNTYNNKKMFALFPENQYCDIYDSPAVKNPVLIYNSHVKIGNSTGAFIGDYAYLNCSFIRKDIKI